MLSAELSRRLAQIWSTPEMYDIGGLFKSELRAAAEKYGRFEALPDKYQKAINAIEDAIRKRAQTNQQ